MAQDKFNAKADTPDLSMLQEVLGKDLAPTWTAI